MIAALALAGGLALAAAGAFAQERSPPEPADARIEAQLLALAARIDAAVAARDWSDVRSAREPIAAALAELSASTATERSARAAAEAGLSLMAAGEFAAAGDAWSHAVAFVDAHAARDDEPLASARLNAADARIACGDLDSASALFESEIARRPATEARDVVREKALQGLAFLLRLANQPERALPLVEEVAAARAGLPPDDEDRLAIDAELAFTQRALGRTGLALARLRELVARMRRLLRPDHPMLLVTLEQCSSASLAAGELEEARHLQEEVVAVRERALAPDDPQITHSLDSLGTVLIAQQDFESARAVFERVLARRIETLPDDALLLQYSRVNLAVALKELGDVERAAELESKAVEALSETVDPEHELLLLALTNLGVSRRLAGKPGDAQQLFEHVLEIQARKLGEEHSDVSDLRMRLAELLESQEQSDHAIAILQDVVARLSASTRCDEIRLEGARRLLFSALFRWRGAAEALPVARAMHTATIATLDRAAATLSPRAAEDAAEHDADAVRALLIAARNLDPRPPELDELAWSMLETARAIGLRSARFVRDCRSSTTAAEALRLRDEIARCDRILVSAARSGRTGDDFDRALRDRERLDLALRKALGAAARPFAPITRETVAARLGEHDATISYWREPVIRFDAQGDVLRLDPDRLVAFVARHDGSLRWFDLGEIAAIEALVERWRAAVTNGAGGRGAAALPNGAPGNPEDESALSQALRSRLLDPLEPAVGDARRLFVALTAPMHALPLDALREGEAFVGDRRMICVLPALAELVDEPRRGAGDGVVALFGAVDYSDPSLEKDVAIRAAGGEVALLRGTPFEAGFPSLNSTGAEVAALQELARTAFPDASATAALLGRDACRRELEELAPRARFLHLATHGFYAPESVPSTADAGSDLRQRVRRLSPMVLCGLALAGANAAPDESGRVEGLITAEEIAGLELPRCELAVLSACETGLGERRANQVVASLQKALHMAGARNAITSVWKVPDEATKELMVDFYRRHWILGEPRHQALWRAKSTVREREGVEGFTAGTRDWAGWLLSGLPE